MLPVLEHDEREQLTRWARRAAPAQAFKPGCTMAPWSSSVNGASVAVGSATVVDARMATSGCSAVAIQAMTIRPSADLTIVADSIKAVGGMQVRSADGKAHKVTLVVPGSPHL